MQDKQKVRILEEHGCRGTSRHSRVLRFEHLGWRKAMLDGKPIANGMTNGDMGTALTVCPYECGANLPADTFKERITVHTSKKATTAPT